MRLLFDQNLSHRLVRALDGLYPDSAHVRDLGLERADDRVIWDYAGEHGYVIVTCDADFSDWSDLLGAPPQIVWIRCGNVPTSVIEDKLRYAATSISEMVQPGSSVSVVEVW